MPASILLGLAIACEVVGTVALNIADGFSKPLALAVSVVGYVLSFVFLALVLKQLDVGLVYAVWAGAGTAAVAVIGVAAFGEPMDAIKAVSIVAIVGGVVGLNLAGAS
jgi:small multidrug resistance pump